MKQTLSVIATFCVIIVAIGLILLTLDVINTEDLKTMLVKGLTVVAILGAVSLIIPLFSKSSDK